MKLGLFTPIFGTLSFDELLNELSHYPAIQAVELGCGGWPGNSHIDVDGLLASLGNARDYRARILDAGLTISALSCRGNPLHPQSELGHRDDATFRQTVRLAEWLEVPVVITFSGCPGGGPNDSIPNWITSAWPPEFPKALDWQWEERLILIGEKPNGSPLRLALRSLLGRIQVFASITLKLYFGITLLQQHIVTKTTIS